MRSFPFHTSNLLILSMFRHQLECTSLSMHEIIGHYDAQLEKSRSKILYFCWNMSLLHISSRKKLKFWHFSEMLNLVKTLVQILEASFTWTVKQGILMQYNAILSILYRIEMQNNEFTPILRIKFLVCRGITMENNNFPVLIYRTK